MVRFALLFGVLAVLAADLASPARALDLERRRMLTSVEHVPWRAVGRVNVASMRETGMCTGTLIDEDLVITAAHCVLSQETGKPWAPGNVHFVAGWRRGQKVASSRAAEIIVHPGFRLGDSLTLDDIAADLAVIRLEEKIPAAAAPSFKVAPPDRDAPTPTIISYRRDRPHALTRQDGCTIRAMNASVILLDCDITYGASGSPVFADADGAPRIIGVISANGRDERTRRPLAYAVRVDSAMPDVLAAMR